jgi:hypothetical protein
MLNSEQLYELHLPSFSNATLPSFKGFDDDHLLINYLRLYDIDQILKPEYIKLLGLDWFCLSYFKKTSLVGQPHADETIFAINWIEGGDGIMEFYDTDEVELSGVTNGAFNNLDLGIVPKYKPICVPSKRYETKNNKAYLVNVSTIHRATGIGPRKCYSLRTNDRHISWDEAIKLFGNLIIR